MREVNALLFPRTTANVLLLFLLVVFARLDETSSSGNQHQQPTPDQPRFSPSSSSHHQPAVIDLQLDQHQLVNLSTAAGAGPSSLALRVNNLGPAVRYVLVQSHSQIQPITLSYSDYDDDDDDHKPPRYGTYVTGRNLGLVVLLDPGDVAATVYLRVAVPPSSSSKRGGGSVRVLLLAQGYSATDAIPGGCNLEFNVEIAPYMQANYDPYKTRVAYQNAAVGYPRAASPLSCDDSQMTYGYDVYLYYMTERSLSESKYFDALRLMSKWETLAGQAQKIKPLFGLARTVFDVATYRRQGAVFVVVVHDGSNTSSRVAYVPVSTYGCELQGDADSCVDILTPFEWILAVFGAVTGLFLCFVGHRFFKISMFTFGFTTLSFVTYILTARLSDADYGELVSVTFLVGVIGGCCWVIFWWFAGMPVLSVLLPGFNLGIIVAGITFFTPVGFVRFLENDGNHWVLFASIVIVVPVLLISFTQKLHILACAVIGSYGVVVLLDRYAGGCLTYIVLNIVRRAVVPGYNHVINPIPFQQNDIILSCLWVALSIGGTGLQLWRERKKPPFPTSPFRARQMARREHQRLIAAHQRGEPIDYDAPYIVAQPNDLAPSAPPTERDPLLGANNGGRRGSSRGTERPPLPYS